MTVKPRKQKEPEEAENYPDTVKMGEVSKDILKARGYVWVASRKQWEMR
jgi:hypothetical protein